MAGHGCITIAGWLDDKEPYFVRSAQQRAHANIM